jgi:hypothetical protein
VHVRQWRTAGHRNLQVKSELSQFLSDTLLGFAMRKFVAAVVVLTGVVLVADESGLFSLLKSNAGIGRQSEGLYLLPTNQLLHPWGEQAAIGRPVDWL